MAASLAQSKARRLNGRFGSLFRQQFVLTRQTNLSYPNFDRYALSGWVLHVGRAVRVARLTDSDGTHIGFALGIVLRDGALISGDISVPAAEDDDAFVPALDRLANELAGRYVLIVLSKNLQSVYPDPVCDMPVVFDPVRQIVGSSLALILHRPVRLNPHFNLGKILRGGRTFTLQHTADAGVFRAMPNHALDLVSFESRRHWPGEDVPFNDQTSNTEEVLNDIIERLGQNFGAMVSNFPSVVPVSGGRDSRTMIACGLTHLDQVEEFSAFRFHNASSIDAARGQEITTKLGYDFKIYRMRRVTHRDRALFHLKSGYAGIRGEFQALGSMLAHPRDHLIVRGNIMELLRANQWRQRHIDKGFIQAHAFRRLKADVDVSDNKQEFERAYTHWRMTLPDDFRERPYDIAFLEMLLPNTQGAFFNGYHDTVFVNPFNDRRLIAHSLQLPVQLRYDDVVIRMLLERTHPELLEIPFH